MYADDLLFLSPTLFDLQKMINICTQTFDTLDMKINESKSTCIKIGPSHKILPSHVTINSTPITWSPKVKYLGLTFSAGQSLTCDLHPSKAKYFGALNAILSKLSPFPPIHVTLALLSSKCVPLLFFGMESISLSKAQRANIDFVYNAQFSKLFHTFDKNIISQCQFYTGYLPASLLLDNRKLNFLINIATGPQSQTKFLLKYVSQKDFIDLPFIVDANKNRLALSRSALQSLFASQIGI